MGTGLSREVKWLGRGVDHLPHLALRLKKEYSYTSTLHLVLRGLFQGEFHQGQSFITSDGQSVILGVEPVLGFMTRS